MGDEPGLYYDYEDQRAVLPKEAFEFQYPAKGDSQLAVQIAAHLRHSGFKPVLERRGFDHAVYVPMILLRPQADIPIVQMSILRGETDIESTELNIQLGQSVESFRDQGYAVIGSGGSYHDFHAIAQAYFENKFVPAGFTAFEDFLESAASIQDPQARTKVLLGWRSLASSYLAHVEGSSEHLMPFMLAAGSGGGRKGVKFDMYTYKGATMSQYMW
ncbi:extradiol ring-cleavage dioxygenase [Trichoderma gamsii]|uniref:Extradiol ring-cleavage dioxygenase n=1 Tax=Trichoderma gamsii TaxID=398673 RepID=A0A2P4ZIR4_9HYPO|nr:extradiol ring-cleavage dioxygenase [Trichoderma gamsii]PON24163.1 extradiol ring-cleavage dioxygenase [Trichoderma gamsii]